jgi:hypothetical protein
MIFSTIDCVNILCLWFLGWILDKSEKLTILQYQGVLAGFAYWFHFTLVPLSDVITFLYTIIEGTLGRTNIAV